MTEAEDRSNGGVRACNSKNEAGFEKHGERGWCFFVFRERCFCCAREVGKRMRVPLCTFGILPSQPRRHALRLALPVDLALAEGHAEEKAFLAALPARRRVSDTVCLSGTCIHSGTSDTPFCHDSYTTSSSLQRVLYIALRARPTPRPRMLPSRGRGRSDTSPRTYPTPT